MTPTRHRVALAAATVAAMLPLVAGCGAGFNAQTLQIRAPADGVEASSGDVRLLNALVVVPVPTSGPKGTIDGTLIVTLANSGDQDDTLIGVASGGEPLTGVSNAKLPAGGVLRIGPGQGELAVAVHGITEVAGGSITLSFGLSRAGTVAVKVPLVAGDGAYASISPPPPASSTPSPSAS